MPHKALLLEIVVAAIRKIWRLILDWRVGKPDPDKIDLQETRDRLDRIPDLPTKEKE